LREEKPMTVESIPPRVEYDYAGAGDYTFLFECVDEDHLTLTHISTAGVSTILTLNSDYTVTLSETIGGTCSVTYAATTGTLRIARSTPVTQEVNLVNNNALDMETLEDALDRNVLILQEFELRLASALQASTWRGDWATSTEYSLLNLVAAPTGDWYSCVIVHTSGTWSTDLAAGYWELIFPFSDVEDLHTEIETWHGEVDTWQGEVSANTTAAAASADLAEEWAEKAEDSAITGHAGQYSALHHAAKAAASAASISLPSIEAGDAEKILRVNAEEDGYDLEALPFASESEATTGTETAKMVSPATTLAAIRARAIPLPPSGVDVTGNIYGFNLSKTGANQVTVSKGSCLDSTLTVPLALTADTAVAIPAVANTIYHIFVVKLVADGSMTVKAYTSEAGVVSDATVDKWRWVGWWKTNGDSVAIEMMNTGEEYSFEVASEVLVATITSSSGQTVDHSSFIPEARTAFIKYTGSGTSVTRSEVFSCLPGTTNPDGRIMQGSVTADSVSLGHSVHAWFQYRADRNFRSTDTNMRLFIHGIKVRR
jgi:hypothetical protein